MEQLVCVQVVVLGRASQISHVSLGVRLRIKYELPDCIPALLISKANNAAQSRDFS